MAGQVNVSPLAKRRHVQSDQIFCPDLPFSEDCSSSYQIRPPSYITCIIIFSRIPTDQIDREKMPSSIRSRSPSIEEQENHGPNDSSLSPTPSFLNDTSGVHSPGVHIPESRDAFFGYSDEKTLRHVRLRLFESCTTDRR